LCWFQRHCCIYLTRFHTQEIRILKISVFRFIKTRMLTSLISLFAIFETLFFLKSLRRPSWNHEFSRLKSMRFISMSKK
jgi:hypothetical protein